MPSYQTAKKLGENALRTIGAFPASQSQADAGELRTTLQWLEMVINTVVGYRPLAGFWRVIEIPIEAGIGDYNLTDYADAAETQHVFSVNIVDTNGEVEPVHMIDENEAVTENLSNTGTAKRALVTKDVFPVLKLYPTPTSEDENAGRVIRLRIQTYQPQIDDTGNGQEKLLVRPSWYLWLTKKLAYEIGGGPVRRLADSELKRFQDDANEIESLLLSRDGQYSRQGPPVTEPMPGG